LQTIDIMPPAADVTDAVPFGTDITGCDREPIHIPGSIQPHALLLIVDRTSRTVVGAAGDVEARFGADWLNAPVTDILGDAMMAALDRSDAPIVSLGPCDAAGGYHAVAARGDGHWLVQFEQPGAFGTTPDDLLGVVDRIGGQFERAGSLLDLCREAVGNVRALTGFDRVMLYRFLDDESGVVLAEDKVPDLHSFLNHHFPASDIPKQARALYIRNRVRVIPDVTYTPCAIRPASAGLAFLDLSDVDARSVSPIHIQYLRNMGVAASASISIVKDGILWGLIACHHMEPRTLSYTERRVCQLLAGGLARQIRAKEEAEDYRDRINVRGLEDVVVARLGEDTDPVDLFDHGAEDLRRMFGADGFAMLHGAMLRTEGRCPDRDDIRDLAKWLTRRSSGPFHTRALSEEFTGAEAYRELASGVLAFTLSAEVPTLMIWFRAEEREVVNWAGNPHKAVGGAPGEPLTPRGSFDAWTEVVRGKARRWTAAEVEAAHRLMRMLFDARQQRRIQDLNRDLLVAVADKDALIEQKDTLLKEVNHRIQNSLQLVMAFLGMQAKAENDDALTRHLEEAQRRLSAVALVHRRLYSDDNVETIDLARYVEELVGEMSGTMGSAWAEQITLDLAPILIPADAAVQVGLILVELVINAQKYAYDGAVGPIKILLEQHRNRFRLIVADRGCGRTGTRKGFGTRMLGAMVRRLQGAMDETSNDPGLRVIVTAAVDQRVTASADMS
jgi:chemotaxis family two-component system sensor kinase Cph1